MSLSARIALSLLSRPERHRYGADPSQVADLHRPRDEGPHPVAVVLHGGYWQAAYGKLITRPLCLDLARRGWAAWNLEYRRLGRRQGGGWPATFDDVAAGIDHLAALDDPRLDLSDVTVIGHSAGGQLALWAGGRPDLPAGAPGADPALTVSVTTARAYVRAAQSHGADITLIEPAGSAHSAITNPATDGWKQVAAWLQARATAGPASVSGASTPESTG